MQQEQESAQLCTNGCGFFGNPASGGMCSVCWKKHVSTHQAESSAAMAVEKIEAAVASKEASVAAAPAAVKEAEQHEEAEVMSAPAAVAEPVVAVAAAAEPEPASAETKPLQKNKKRCWECKKKVGLTGIECRCGFVFCSNHRYPDQHTCSFDFKAADRAELARRNPGGGEFGKLERL